MQPIDQSSEKPTLTKGLRDGLERPASAKGEEPMGPEGHDCPHTDFEATVVARPETYVYIPTLADEDGVASFNIRTRFPKKVLNRYRMLKAMLPEPKPTVEELYIEALDVGGEDAFTRRGMTMPEYLR